MKCDQCGIEFVPDKPWQRFHSAKCRQRWHDNQKREIKLTVRDTIGAFSVNVEAMKPLIEQARQRDQELHGHWRSMTEEERQQKTSEAIARFKEAFGQEPEPRRKLGRRF